MDRLVLDEPFPVVVRDLVAEMAEKRTVRLIHLLPDLGADRIVGFADVEGDLAMVMAGQDFALPILAARRSRKSKAIPVSGCSVLLATGKSRRRRL